MPVVVAAMGCAFARFRPCCAFLGLAHAHCALCAAVFGVAFARCPIVGAVSDFGFRRTFSMRMLCAVATCVWRGLRLCFCLLAKATAATVFVVEYYCVYVGYCERFVLRTVLDL